MQQGAKLGEEIKGTKFFLFRSRKGPTQYQNTVHQLAYSFCFLIRRDLVGIKKIRQWLAKIFNRGYGQLVKNSVFSYF